MPSGIQDAYFVLGVKEPMWNQAVKAKSDELSWDKLSTEMKEVALFIGYTQVMWDSTAAPVALPVAALVQNAPALASPAIPPVMSAHVGAPQPQTNPRLLSPASSNMMQSSMACPFNNTLVL